jgi:hypothetical protein
VAPRAFFRCGCAPWARAASAVALAGGLAACGDGVEVLAPTPPTPIDAVADDFPADPNGARYHPMHRAAFGPI